ncbi:hypothetical protein H5S09_03695 [Limosilactobacillus sp. STM2_1]|uniref:Uncharacterized protein n=1 Tax=Limosilactobacillus rudii TaxID=2759755 RepID=A0A7W3ULF9_9LACO|nr:hypothetical protein [Limosilactobacillus rudii]MBB1079070.1 hypothetical protein [Limosilactobacillus rudii]MBB1097055.1 hypothetical protein [Limosilactobacillus rudii]MCD7134023.1 hypothetical protein [Limosilactobacillus rudii]
MAQQAMQNGILPGDFYKSSFSDMMAAQNAKARKDRPQDPLTLVGSEAFLF